MDQVEEKYQGFGNISSRIVHAINTGKVIFIGCRRWRVGAGLRHGAASEQERAAEKQKCCVPFLQRLRNTSNIFKTSESTSDLSEAKSPPKRQFHQSLGEVCDSFKNVKFPWQHR